MASGLPAVATNVASLPEIVRDGIDGFLVPPNDPAALGRRLRQLVENPGEARAMGAAGRERVLAEFSWDSVVDRCLDAYAPSLRTKIESRSTASTSENRGSRATTS